MNQQVEELNQILTKILETTKVTRNLSHSLPVIFTWNGKPLTLIDHFLFEPLFKLDLPPQTLFICGRQVGKTLSVSAQQVLFSWLIPGFRRLVITPLHIHSERMSVDYLRPLIETSPLYSLFVDNSCRRTIMEKSFKNNSSIRLVSMHVDPTRIRGAPADAINYDEVQDIELEYTDVANECLSHSPWKLKFFTGTAKTLDNPIEWLWQRSSKAEWCIPCTNCKYENVCSTKCDLLNMLGPLRPDISEEKPGLICAKCKLPISPRHGFWLHGSPNRRFDFAGYHIPQPIIPIHYANPRGWSELLHKMENMVGGFTAFKNEILGESEDVGVKLISRDDLIKNATLGPNTDANLEEKLPEYHILAMGIDWGGGGESGLSRTTAAIVGYRNGEIHVLRGLRFSNPDPSHEVAVLLKYISKCRIGLVAHDANPSGSLREILLTQTAQAELPLIPIQYYGAVGGKLIVGAAGTGKSLQRQLIRLHKSRSIQILCAAIKLGYIKFFEYSGDDPDGPNLLLHFLSIFEERVEHPMGEDQYIIQRNPALSDDFVHAVNFAVVSIWQSYGWPSFAMRFLEPKTNPLETSGQTTYPQRTVLS